MEPVSECGGKAMACTDGDQEFVIDGREELGNVKADHGCDHLFPPPLLYVVGNISGSIYSRVLPCGAKLAWVKDAISVGIILYLFIDDLFHPLGNSG